MLLVYLFFVCVLWNGVGVRLLFVLFLLFVCYVFSLLWFRGIFSFFFARFFKKLFFNCFCFCFLGGCIFICLVSWFICCVGFLFCLFGFVLFLVFVCVGFFLKKDINFRILSFLHVEKTPICDSWYWV